MNRNDADSFARRLPTGRWRVRLVAVAAGTACAFTAIAQTGADAAYRRPATFRIHADVVNPDVQPFTATIPGFGNSLVNEGSGFEPMVYRNRYKALESQPNRVVVQPIQLSQFDSVRDGYLDGADVRIYRIENGKFRLVREDRIAEGGFHVSGWQSATRPNQILPAEMNRFTFRWDTWNRQGVKYYFAVKAVDRRGNSSPASNVVDFERPERLVRAETQSGVDYRPQAGGPNSAQLPAPRNLRGRIGGDGGLLLEWDPVVGPEIAGYVVLKSDLPPERHAGFHFDLAGVPKAPQQQVRAGDMVFVHKKFYSASRNRTLSNRVWGADREIKGILPGLVKFFPDEVPGKTWQLLPHSSDTPVTDPGETYLRVDLQQGMTEALVSVNHAGTEQHWYEVLDKRPYKVEAWLRKEGSGSVRFRFNGYFGAGRAAIAPIVFDAGPNWKKFVASFVPPEIQGGRAPGQMLMEFSGPGSFSVDNFRVYRADADYLDYLPSQYEVVRNSGVLALRTHGIIKTGTRTYDMEQFTNPGGVTAHSGGWESGAARLNTLPQTLAMIRKAGVRPWLQMEFHMSPSEWLGFVEYLAAPYDPAIDKPEAKPWAYKRHKQGQARPWTDEFDRIYFELGNETWNGLFHPWVFDEMVDAANGRNYTRGQVYGLFHEHVVGILRSSPHWARAKLDTKVEFVLGGWIGQPYGRDAAGVSSSSKHMTIADYIGGWDVGEGPPKLDAASLFSVLSQANQATIPMADQHAREMAGLSGPGRAEIRMGTYEAGPGFALNGLNGARVTEEQSREQELVMKSLAAGTATLDSFLAKAYRGFGLQNFFTLDAGTQWRSHARWYDGGQAFPSWKLISLFNREGTGSMLRTEAISVPTTDLKAFVRRRAVPNAPLAAVYATRKGNRLTVFAVSRKVPGFPVVGDEGFTPLTIDLPIRRARTITLYRMTGDPKANNVSRDDVRVERIELAPSAVRETLVLDSRTGADDRGLPPASTFVYVFDGVEAAAQEGRR